MAIAIYLGVKWLTMRRARVESPSRWRAVAYLLAWPGLDADAFLAAPASSVITPRRGEWLLAAVKLGLGLTLLYGGQWVIAPSQRLLLGWVGMVGIVFTLHFGLFHLLSCFWRFLGVQAEPLMQWPIASQTVAEFWGQRWNTAFRDLTYRFLFRPLSRHWGPARGFLIGFLFSGLVHDAVISLPAGGGYGYPTLYFLLQALGIQWQRTRWAPSALLGQAWLSRATTLAVVAGPAPWLFHAPFVCRIVLPFMQAIGAS
ncbi:MBOAT family protein [Aeoliella mucimassa]|uniref:MBOAT family protein n=1 Tax=Aeoliella mucimassa TaxID=2527972 RepID=UPI0018D2B584|nr:MBOAT family protein [Aeoliella mucimassa]